MDTGTIIISLVFLGICILPIIYFKISRQKNHQRLLNALQNIANPYNSKITEHGICRQMALGIDSNLKIVYYFNATPMNIISHNRVDLNEVKSFKIKKTLRPSSTMLDKLDLVFYFKDPKKPEIAFNFFESEQTFQIGNEMIFLEAWENKIKQVLQTI
ncbi:MAG: hypothetical protein Q8K70_12040 [Bacteroidota bacterium]|nr:hypothetical protein [Bacteroidota bacterium]